MSKFTDPKLTGVVINDTFFPIREIASLEVDPQKCFSELCPQELPVSGALSIVPELDRNARHSYYRTVSKDNHPANGLWNASNYFPQFSAVNLRDVDIRWNQHGVCGTAGAELLPGLPHVREYDFVVYKGNEVDMHPYGCLFHDLCNTMTTGLREFYHYNGVKLVIVGGLATDYCVKNSVLQLLAAGFAVFVNHKACAGIAPETCSKAWGEMFEAGALANISWNEREADKLTEMA